MQRYAEQGAAALGIESYCRLDFMMAENGTMYCLEANTLPGMTPTSLLPQEAQVLGMNFADLCDHLVQLSLKNMKHKKPFRLVCGSVGRLERADCRNEFSNTI